jgi:glycosyltransferase involved in cell wall biosynthesis
MKLRLLFITPRIDADHDDFAFTSLWAQAFADAGFAVEVICLDKRKHALPFPVHSLGRERGWSNLRSFLEFQKLILTIPHDRVFVHMNPRWLAAGAWYWWVKHIPAYLWYTHYTRPISLKIGDKIVKRMFAATAECLPQYANDPRKVVTGHGIDLAFWDVPELPAGQREPATHLLAVHRVSRSKRLDLTLKALALLPPEYTLTHYGRPQDPKNDPAYAEEIARLADSPELRGRVRFMGGVPMPELRRIYPRFQALVNMVPQTIDKTVLEGMYCGLTPVITAGHADAIGYPRAPADDSPEAIARHILGLRPDPRAELRDIVRSRHSLHGLVEKMARYIRNGI